MQIAVTDLQAYLSEHYASRVDEQGLFMKLVEELGEVAEILNMRAKRKAGTQENLDQQLGYELADMLHYIVAIAAVNGIDLNEVIFEKDRAASIKYHRERNLEQYIEAKNAGRV